MTRALKSRLAKLEQQLAPKPSIGAQIVEILSGRVPPSEPEPIDIGELAKTRFGKRMLGAYVRMGRFETLPDDAPQWLREYHEIWRTVLKPLWDAQRARLPCE